MTIDAELAAETIIYGDYADILKPDSKWVIGGFPGWEFREPDAIVVVQNGTLRVACMPLTRENAALQILDNAKHMYFSRETFRVPTRGRVTIDVDIKATKINGVPDDFYDGFVSLNLLDFSTGIAVDFSVSNERFATVYARLPFPGSPPPESDGQRYFGLFKEQPLPRGPRQTHHYTIVYDHGADALSFFVDGALVNEEHGVPKIDSFIAALGLMTEKDLVDGKSVSCHGQGLVGEWGPLTITFAPPD